MKTYNIEDIVDSLVGSTSVYCETNHDNESYENMKELESLIFHLLKKITDNASYANRSEYSAKRLSSQAKDILKEIRIIADDYLRDYFNEIPYAEKKQIERNERIIKVIDDQILNGNLVTYEEFKKKVDEVNELY